MPVQKAQVPAAAPPKFGDHFDAWNSSSTGHQRAENRLGGSIGWRQSRNVKLSRQFKSSGTGGERLQDLVGAGSEDWDENAKALIPKHVRERAKTSVSDMLVGKPGLRGEPLSAEEKLMAQREKQDDLVEQAKLNRVKKIFDGLVIYINGSTHPQVSNHRLKHLLSENGARLSIHLGRRTVTHVILGRPSGPQGQGAGGGLSGSKIEKEIRRIGGCGVKYVGIEWALESIKAGKRLPETRFANLKIAAKRQQSVYSIFKKAESSGDN